MSASDLGQSDYSMQSRRWSQQKLITCQTAIEIARLVHRDSYSQVDLDANEPVTARADGDTWLVSGAKENKYEPGSKLDGALEMRISQFDGQILSYVLSFVLPRPAN
jgi:hypothetical protein